MHLSGILILVPSFVILSTFLLFWLLRLRILWPRKPIRVFFIPLQGYLPAHQEEILEVISQKLSTDLTGAFFQTKGLKTPESIFPVIEAEIDLFLKERLPKALPVLGTFLGESILRQVKAVFMEELKGMLPVILELYSKSLLDPPILHSLLAKVLGNIPPSIWRRAWARDLKSFRNFLLRQVLLYGLLLGAALDGLILLAFR